MSHEEYYDESLHRAWTGVDNESDEGYYRQALQLHQGWPAIYPHPDELREMGRAS